MSYRPKEVPWSRQCLASSPPRMMRYPMPTPSDRASSLMPSALGLLIRSVLMRRTIFPSPSIHLAGMAPEMICDSERWAKSNSRSPIRQWFASSQIDCFGALADSRPRTNSAKPRSRGGQTVNDNAACAAPVHWPQGSGPTQPTSSNGALLPPCWRLIWNSWD